MKWSSCSAVERNAAKVSGAWLFKGTRLPVATLFEVLADGATVDQFMEWYPGPSRDLIEEVLEFAKETLGKTAA